MSDLKEIADDLTTKAALAAGKDAVKGAVEDFLSSDEEKARKEEEKKAKSKSRRNKLIAYAAVGVLLVVGVLGFVASYWHWFLLAGMFGLAGLYGWSRLRKRFSSSKTDEAEEASDVEAEAEEVIEAPVRVEIDPQEEARRAAERKKARAEQARIRAEAEAIEEQEIDDELAAMKARLDD